MFVYFELFCIFAVRNVVNGMLNPLKTIANDTETERMNATDLLDEAQLHEVTERFDNYY